MANIGALFSAVRGGGTGAIAAARELQGLAQTGQLSGPQLQALDAAAASPELRDVFAAAAQNFDALTGQSSTRLVGVEQLAVSAQALPEGAELPGRFFTDATLHRAELTGTPGLSENAQAQRLLEFFEPYAERFVDGRAALGETQAAKVQAKFDRALQQLGFAEVRTADGRSGLDAAREMLRANDAAGVRAARPEPLLNPQTIVPQLRVPTTRVEPEPKPEAGPDRKRQRNGVLGSRMLWNVLHLLRGEELDDVAKKDAFAQLVVAASLLLVFMGIVLTLVFFLR